MTLAKFLTVDPGEDTGWSIWDGPKLLNSGTSKMWHFSDDVWEAAINAQYQTPPVGLPIVEGEEPELPVHLWGIRLVVVENWSLYPWVMKTGAMDFDECRTARLIGSIYAACRFTGWSYEQQPALIKDRAMAAGAESYFSHPLRENRHANDAIMHGVFRNAKDAGAQWTDLSAKQFAVPA